MSDPNQRKRLWIHFANAYKQINSKVLLKMDEPDGLGADAYRALSDLHKAGPEPAGMDKHDFQCDRLWRLVRQATLGGDITLARGAEILGIKLNDMRDLAESWAN
jgi:hypothetical protein